MELTVEQVAHQLLDVVPLIMLEIRSEMRRSRGGDLSVVQFRALGQIDHNPAASLAELAEYVGLTSSSTSTLVDGLVEKGLIERRDAPEDRRRLALTLTKEGRLVLQKAIQNALNSLACRLKGVPVEELNGIYQTMHQLKGIYTGENEHV